MKSNKFNSIVMLNRIKKFVSTSLLGGLIVILPLVILIVVFGNVYDYIAGIVDPFSRAMFGKNDMLAVIIVVSIILLICFMIGMFIKTKAGKYLYNTLDTKIKNVTPGYAILKEIVKQLLGVKKLPFTDVALAKLSPEDVYQICFITGEYKNGTFSIFVPNSPNPTSGSVFFVDKDRVEIIDVSVEEAMKTIVSCGAGGEKFI